MPNAFKPPLTAHLKVGLTGGIGSGKSTVAQMLTQCTGIQLVDTDAIARALTQPGGAAISAIAQHWGDQMIDPHGAMNRQRMRTIIFANPLEKQKLEAILHPLIWDHAWTQASTAQEKDILVFDIPLLAESVNRPTLRWLDHLDHVLLVDCDTATQVQRVMQRSGWTAAMAQSVIDAQAPRLARQAIADTVILNEGLTLVQLESLVKSLTQTWRKTMQG